MAQSAVRRPNGGRPTWPGWAAWTLCVLLLGALAGYAIGPLARQQGWSIDSGSPTVDPEVIAMLHPRREPLGSGVIDPARQPDAHQASTQYVQQAMAATPPEFPGRYAGAIANLAGGSLDYDLASATPMIPASTLKIMTAIAVLDALGPQHTFTTSVVALNQQTIVLVGGGDPLLSSTPASYPHADTLTLPTTADLAARTAAALQAQGITSVSLGYDETLFSGAAWHPDWGTADRAFVAPVSALVVDEGATSPGVDSPAAAAARIFADQLRASGIAVNGDPVAASGAGAPRLAAVDSVPLSLLVQELLVHSDNFVAEMLLRQLALASGETGSFEGGAAALTASLTRMGLWREGQQIVDGSGLSMNNRLTPAALVAALQLATERGDLAGVLAGMPVGAATGTLTNRFGDARSVPARGQVRAKTGTLDQVSGLAGYTPTTDGGLLAFAFIGNDLPRDQDVRPWFDHVGAALAGCDCVA